MPDSAILNVTDLHYGKRSGKFNPANLELRMGRLADRAGKKLSGIDALTIAVLGDVNDGSGIFPTQIHHQAITNPAEQAELASDMLTEFVTRLKKKIKRVRVFCVPGNHGRVGKFAHEAANWDLITYAFLKTKLAPLGVEVKYPSGDNIWIAKFSIYKHSYLMYHGHGIRMYQSIPWYGISQRMLRWNATSLAPFAAMLSGHFHVCGDMSFNRLRSFLSGTPVLRDQWALTELGLESESEWWLLGVDEKRPVTWQERLVV